MEIIRNACEVIQFKELCEGDVFIAVDDEKLYMKTSEAYEYPDDPDHCLNAVSLEDGSLIKFNEWERVRLPKRTFLTVDE